MGEKQETKSWKETWQGRKKLEPAWNRSCFSQLCFWGVLNTCLLAWTLTYTDSKQCHGDQLWDFIVIPFAMTLSLHLIGCFRHWALENSPYNLSFTASHPWSLKSFTLFHLSGSCSQYIPVENSKHQNFLLPPPKTEKWTKSVPLEHSASEVTLLQLNRKRRQLKNHQKKYHVKDGGVGPFLHSSPQTPRASWYLREHTTLFYPAAALEQDLNGLMGMK